MKVRKIIGVAFAFVLALWIAAPGARASERDQASQLTFSQSVQLPGNTVLPAGTYWFVLADSAANHNIVHVFDANWEPVATVLTNSTQIPNPTDHTRLTFAERSSNQPVLLLKWYYPGDPIGHEFVYSGALAEQTVRTVTVVGQPD